MTKEQQQSIEILVDLICRLEPRLAGLAPWIRKVSEMTDRWYSSEGDQGVKRMKDCLGQAWLAILSEPTQQLDFVSTEGNIPKVVKPLVDHVSKLTLDARLMSAVLTLIRITDLWKADVNNHSVTKSLDVIQNSKLPTTARPFIKEFVEFVQQFIEQFPKDPVVKQWNKAIQLSDSETVLYRESAGPNGPLTQNSHKDLKTLCEAQCSDGRSLLEWIYELEHQITQNTGPGQSFRVDTRLFQALSSWDGFADLETAKFPGKITSLSEKSGKVRLVASPDYWTQLAMRPISNWLFSVLRAWPSDCTFDQRAAIPKIQEWQAEGCEISSFDQSSCTDLFPFDMQLSLLSLRFGQPLSEAVQHVLVDRDWEIKLPNGITKTVRWSVGQPMGVFGSWPLMALTHHFLVQYSYWRSSGKRFSRSGPYRRYCICGDDIVIADKSVADSYLRVVKALGMKVNLAKSHRTGGKTNIPVVSEFAKITVWKGQPLYPIKPNMVLSSVKDWRKAIPLFVDLAQNPGFSIKKRTLEVVIRRHYNKGYKYLMSLLTIPREYGGIGYRGSTSLRDEISAIDVRQIHPYVLYMAYKIKSGLLTESRALETVGEALASVPAQVRNLHPVKDYKVHCIRLDQLSYLQPDLEEISIKDIVQDIVTGGLRSYNRFFDHSGEDHPNPVWTDEHKSLDLQATLWEKALRRKRYFPKEYAPHSSSFIIDTICNDISPVSESTNFIRTLSNSELNQRQYDLICNVLLARRSIKG